MARTEIELNKEVLDYKESIFFGLSFRQFVCSLLAAIVAVTVNFSLRNILAKEILSWLCLILACPFAVASFFKLCQPENLVFYPKDIQAIAKSYHHIDAFKLLIKPMDIEDL